MATPIKVLACFKSFLPEVAGGISTAIRDFALGLRPEFDMRVLTCRVKGPTDEISVDGIPVRRCRNLGDIFSTPVSPSYFPAFRKEAQSAGLIALHSPFPLGDLAILRDRCVLPPFVVHWHADLVSYPALRPFVAPLVERTLRGAAAIIVSHEKLIAGSPLLAHHGAKCAVIPFGLDFDYWSSLSPADAEGVDALRKRKPRLVVTCSRLVAYKGLDVLINAADGLDGDIVIIGKGPLEGALRRQAAALPKARIEFVGSVSPEKLRIYLHASQVFAFPSVSDAETFGISQIEAMSCGSPIVNTRLSTAVTNVARHGIEAITVEPGDVDGLRNALQLLLDQPELRRQMSQAAVERARNFSRAASAKALADVYRSCLNSK